MRILYYDCFCGISGDMNLGALIDLGVDADYLKTELAKLNINEEFELKIEKKLKKGISGTKVDVILASEKEHKCCGKHKHGHAHKDGEHHDHSGCKGHGHHHHHHGEKHSHDHKHDHHHTHDHSHSHEHHHEHRNLTNITKIINSSELKIEVKEMAIKMFMEVAAAEAKVHGKSIDEVHFHEVGATDSIVDIVGAAICLDYLKVDKIMASSVQLGGGFVNCAHGKIPVPAPATVEILYGVPVKTGLVQSETTTPTGAAILSATVEEYTDNIDFQIEKTAYGLGTRELEVPNVLRVYLGNVEENADENQKKESTIERGKQYILETNIDDMNPELYQYVEEKLLANGARDVYKTPIVMKKGRAAVKLTILYSIEKEEEVMDVIFKETTSIGFRKYEVEKVVLKREFIKVNTKFGDLTIKKSIYKDVAKYKAEYEECKKAAQEFGVSIREVYREAEKAINLL